MVAEGSHPTQSGAPGAKPLQPGAHPPARLVSPEEAFMAEFVPDAAELADRRTANEHNGRR